MKHALWRSIRPVLTAICLKKYGGVWGLKRHLQAQPAPTPWLLDIYDNYFRKSGAWVGYNADFAGVPCFPHGPAGVFISGGARIGRNAVIFQHVVVGSNMLRDSHRMGSPTIGDNVYMGAGAKIIGAVRVGDNCRIGANAVVYQDLPPHSVAVPSPTRVLQKENLDNRYYSRRGGEWVYFDDGRWVTDPVEPSRPERENA